MGWFSKLFGNNPPKKSEEDDQLTPGKANIEVKGKMGRKKVIEANLGPDGKPLYTGEQLQTAVSKYKQRKSAIAKAKEEEKAYVEHRKAEILRQFQPKVGTLRLGDDAFPKRRRVAMGFGERKAHFLAIRPKPKYATWIGRKKGIIEAKPKINPTIQTQNAIVTDHSAVPEGDKGQDKDDKKEGKSGMDGPKEKEAEKSAVIKEETPKEPEDTNAIIKRVMPKKPLLEKQPLNIDEVKGIPPWIPLQQAHQDKEATEDDLPVDMDILEKVCAGEKQLATKPFIKVEFDPYGPVKKFKDDDVLFGKDTYLFANTVESVIGLQPETKLPSNDNSMPQVKIKIKWDTNMPVVTFNPTYRLIRKPDKPFYETMKQNIRENKKK